MMKGGAQALPQRRQAAMIPFPRTSSARRTAGCSIGPAGPGTRRPTPSRHCSRHRHARAHGRSLSASSVVTHIALWAPAGVSIRALLGSISGKYCATAPLFPDIAANVIGCGAMGLLLAWQGRDPDMAGTTLALHTGLKTGFCGSLTTFSSWMMAARLSTGGIQQGLAIVACGMLTAIGALRAGHAVGSRALQTPATAGEVPHEGQRRPFNVSSPAAPITILLPLVTAAICSLLTVQVSHAAARGSKLSLIAAALLLAPVGAVARWRLSRINAWAAAKALTETAQVADRKHMSGMPCGTLAANVLACIGVFVLASTRTYSCSPPPQGFALPAWCAGALAVGLMGSLSTVSTFIAEVDVLLRERPASSAAYVAVSVGLAQLCGALC